MERAPEPYKLLLFLHCRNFPVQKNYLSFWLLGLKKRTSSFQGQEFPSIRLLKKLLQYINIKGSFGYCNNIPNLLNDIGIVKHSPENWRLLINSFKQNFKCVLLCNGNKYGSISIAQSFEAEETYGSIEVVLELIGYNEHQWIIFADLKMVWFRLGQQSSYTKYLCFL